MTTAYCLVPRGFEPGAMVQNPVDAKHRHVTGRRDGGRYGTRLALARRLLDDYLARQPAAPRPRCVATGLSTLDEAFGGGLPLGALCQMGSTTAGAGALSLALRLAHAAADQSRLIFLIDSAGNFYPPAAAQGGVNLERLVLVRPSQPRQALWAAEQVLRCSAAGAVIGLWPQLDEWALRRLQLAAEAGGGVGLLVNGAGRMTPTPFAAAHLMVEPFSGHAETLVGPANSRSKSEGSINKTHLWYRRLAGALDTESVSRAGAVETPVPHSQPGASATADLRAVPQILSASDGARLVRVYLSMRRRALPSCIILDLHHASGDVPLHAIPGDRLGRAQLRAIG